MTRHTGNLIGVSNRRKVESSTRAASSVIQFCSYQTMSTAAASSSKQPKPTRRSKKAAPISASSGSETDSSEDVTEDEDGVDLTPALDAAILRTLAKIRNKRGVYEGENVLENELKEAEEKVISAGIKAMPNRREEIKVSYYFRLI